MPVFNTKKVDVVTVIYLVGFLDLLGVSMIIPILFKHARNLGASPTTNGVIGSVYGGLQLFSSPVVGRWSDFSGRRTVLLWCLFLSSIGYAVLGMANSITILVLARIPPGLFKHTQDLARSFLADNVPKSQRSIVFGRFQAIGGIAFVIGPLLGGHIADIEGGFRLVALATTLCFLLSLGLFKHVQSINRLLLVDTLHTEERMERLGRYNAIATAGFILGPSVSGAMLDEADGLQRIAMAIAFLFIINAGLVWCFVPSEAEDKKTSQDGGNQQFLTWKNFHPLSWLSTFKKIRWDNLWDIFLIRFLLGFALLIYRNNFAMMLDYKFEMSAKTVGYLISYSAVIGTLCGFMVGRISDFYNNDGRLLLHSAMLCFASISVLVFSPSIPLMIISLAPLSMASSLSRVCVTNLTIEKGRGQDTGILLGLGASCLSFARMVSPTIGGVAQELHVAGPGIIGSLSCALAVMFMIIVPQKIPVIHSKQE